MLLRKPLPADFATVRLLARVHTNVAVNVVNERGRVRTLAAETAEVDPRLGADTEAPRPDDRTNNRNRLQE